MAKRKLEEYEIEKIRKAIAALDEVGCMLLLNDRTALGDSCSKLAVKLEDLVNRN